MQHLSMVKIRTLHIVFKEAIVLEIKINSQMKRGVLNSLIHRSTENKQFHLTTYHKKITDERKYCFRVQYRKEI